MRTSTTTHTDDGFQVEHIYSWGGNMDHSETIVTCETCGASWHSDFGPFDDDPDLHGKRCESSTIGA